MNDFKEIYFKNEKGHGLFIKIPAFYSKPDVFVNEDWLQLKTKNGHNAIPLSKSDLQFIDFAYYLSKDNCDKIFGSDDAYISYLYHKNIETYAEPKNGRWILLFHYS